ncbi:MAG TPA: HNH endonuclease signature motif containing protein [Solirubrobacteraceae bacterium]|nr:HNH endonuclease signature motif containing protein [Solirubrobacteraceae bacterium]
MIRVDNRAEVVKLGWTLPRMFTGRYTIQIGKTIRAERWRQRAISSCFDTQQGQPVAMIRDGRRTLWMFQERFYWESDGLGGEDVKALVMRRERKNHQTLRTAHSLMNAAATGEPTREPVPVDLRRAIYERDGGACCLCGAAFDLQYDHVLPVALGGATTFENLQLLCGSCNRAKSDSI